MTRVCRLAPPHLSSQDALSWCRPKATELSDLGPSLLSLGTKINSGLLNCFYGTCHSGENKMEYNRHIHSQPSELKRHLIVMVSFQRLANGDLNSQAAQGRRDTDAMTAEPTCDRWTTQRLGCSLGWLFLSALLLLRKDLQILGLATEIRRKVSFLTFSPMASFPV